MSILNLNIFEHQENTIWASKTEIESSNKFWIDENWPSKPQSLELSYCAFEVLRSLTLNSIQISSEWTSKMRWKTTVLLDMILGNLSNKAEQASLVIHLFNTHSLPAPEILPKLHAARTLWGFGEIMALFIKHHPFGRQKRCILGVLTALTFPQIPIFRHR